MDWSLVCDDQSPGAVDAGFNSLSSDADQVYSLTLKLVLRHFLVLHDFKDRSVLFRSFSKKGKNRLKWHNKSILGWFYSKWKKVSCHQRDRRIIYCWLLMLLLLFSSPRVAIFRRFKKIYVLWHVNHKNIITQEEENK